MSLCLFVWWRKKIQALFTKEHLQNETYENHVSVFFKQKVKHYALKCGCVYMRN